MAFSGTVGSNPKRIPVVDLFAGPGGLSEGFHAHAGEMKFDIVLSIEKDATAHKTLELRSFLRQFPSAQLPREYYSFLKSEIPNRSDLLRHYPEAALHAANTAWHAELGKEPNRTVYQRIERALAGAQHWVLLGGPPCQAYSVIGRSRMGKLDSFADDHRHTLYREYLKIVAAFQPTVFVMENVKGILSSQHKDQAVFNTILSDLRRPWAALSVRDRSGVPKPSSEFTYRIYSFSVLPDGDDKTLEPNDYIIRCEDYAIPQRRHRVILFGVRSDCDRVPPVLEPAGRRVRVRDVLDGMPPLRSRVSGAVDDVKNWSAEIRNGKKSCCSECMGRHRGLGKLIEESIANLPKSATCGGRYVRGGSKPKRLAEWLGDSSLGGVLQHETRSHMPPDLHRYLFCANFARWKGRSPSLDEFPAELLPNHRNAVVGRSGKVADFADRFRVQVWDEPATTVTCHISKDGHYFIHPDPVQCRSLSVREAARLQTFPDNYFFAGSRTQQYHQVGNAVPPFLAFQLAGVVAELLASIIADFTQIRARRIRGTGV